MKRVINLFVLITLLALTFSAVGVTPAQAAPPAFTKTYPANGETNVPIDPMLYVSWTATSGDYLQLCFDTIINGACDDGWGTFWSGATTINIGVNYNTTYEWQLRAFGDGVFTDADGGTWFTFTTADPPAPEIFVNADGISFGLKSLNTNTDWVITITNSGNADLTLTTPITISGADASQFSIQAQPSSPVAGSTSTTFTVRFTPTSVGIKWADIYIYNNDSDENPHRVDLNGIGGYTVTFDTNGGTGFMGTQAWYGPLFGPTALTLNAFTNAGFTFAGWGTAPGGPVVYADEALYDFNADIVLYAQWTANQYTITFDSAGGSPVAPITQAYGTPVTAPANPTRAGYTFAGWNPAVPATMPLGGAALTAQWTVNQYTITFDSAGGSPVAPITQAYGTPVTAPADPTRAGYTFAGWNPAVPATMPLGGAALTAQWTVNQYTITFDSAGGSPVAPITQAYGTPVTAPADPTRAGYTFAGWNPAVPATMPLGGAALTAQWTVNQYTITFDSAGGSPVAPITQDYGSAVTAPADPTRAGYTFAGWNPAVPATMPLGGAALTAQWTVNNYTVSFDAQGGSPTPGNQSVAFGGLVSDPGVPTRAGHLFNGWFTASSGGTQWNFASDTMGAGDMTLFAQWTAYTEVSATFTSVGNYDGYVFESGENTGVGNLANAVSPFAMVGDHMQDRQLRSVLHFDTSSLPDNAVITNITLSIKRINMLGAPFTSLGTLQADIASPFFGPEMTLKAADFQAAPVFAAAGAFNPVPATGNWYSAGFDPASFSSLNLAGTTQFRLAFSLEDDDDLRPDMLMFYSGNFRTVSYRPVLVITYYVP